jgi:hypothetical protein
MTASTPKRSRKKTHLGRSPATKSPSKNKSAKRGRGRPPKRPEEKFDAAQINAAFSRELLRAMDAWIAEQPDRPVRPEAIRRLVSAALGLTRPKRSAPPTEPHFEPSPGQIEAIDRYRAGIELNRVDAISLLVDVGLRRVRTGNID